MQIVLGYVFLLNLGDLALTIAVLYCVERQYRNLACMDAKLFQSNGKQLCA
jgi:hypothetical protein